MWQVSRSWDSWVSIKLTGEYANRYRLHIVQLCVSRYETKHQPGGVRDIFKRYDACADAESGHGERTNDQTKIAPIYNKYINAGIVLK